MPGAAVQQGRCAPPLARVDPVQAAQLLLKRRVGGRQRLGAFEEEFARDGEEFSRMGGRISVDQAVFAARQPTLQCIEFGLEDTGPFVASAHRGARKWRCAIGGAIGLIELVRKFDKLGTEQRAAIQPKIEDLHMVVAELSDRLEQLKVECPTDWSPIKSEIDEAHVDMRSKYEETMDEIGQASPVSIPG